MMTPNLYYRFLRRTGLYLAWIVLIGGVLGYAINEQVALWWIAGWALAGLSFHLYHIAILLNRLTRRFTYPLRSLGVWRDIFILQAKQWRQQRRRQWQLHRLLKRFTHASALIPDGMIVLDATHHVEWFNAAAARQFDLKRTTGHYLDIRTLIRQPAFHAYLKHPSHLEPLPLVMDLPNHPKQTVSCQLVPFEGTTCLLLVRDITELEYAQTMRRDFVANISHEMRTPLTVISGFLETFLEMDKPDETVWKQYLPTMLAQSERMKHLLEDLLTLSRLESQTSPILEAIAMPEMLATLVQEAQSLSQGKHTIHIENSGPATLMGQARELRSAFSNLIINAIRYTPPDGHIFLAWAINQTQQPVFTVRDTGIGIAPKHIPRLTERFYRVDEGRSREEGGTGLGLSIVYHIALRHNATLGIESQLGQGSSFSLCFPKNDSD